jgi:two-component system sensor histidine kinase AlgZ
LPDWRNFGVMLRVLLGVNGLALLAALVQAGDIGKWLGSYLQMAAIVEPLAAGQLGLLSLPATRCGAAAAPGAGVRGLAGVLAAALFLYARSLSWSRPVSRRAVLLAMATACCWPI